MQLVFALTPLRGELDECSILFRQAAGAAVLAFMKHLLNLAASSAGVEPLFVWAGLDCY